MTKIKNACNTKPKDKFPIYIKGEIPNPATRG